MSNQDSMALNWKLHHVGVVVRDLDTAVEFYQNLGIVEKVSRIQVSEGKKAKLIGKFVRIGDLNLEFWQPIRGTTVQQEFLDTHGEGINHIAFSVDNYNETYNNWCDDKGVRQVFGSKPPAEPPAGGGGYFDLRQGHNILFELINLPPGHEITNYEI